MGRKKKNQEHWSIKPILKYNAIYNIIFGERSNGKTYGTMEHCIEDWYKKGRAMALIRRFDEDFTGKRGSAMFRPLVQDGKIAKLTNNEWTGIKYYSGRWWLSKKDPDNEGKTIVQDEPFCYGFSLSAMEHDKSTGYPSIKNIMFDEFITRGYYLQDEFVLFMNVLSTIIRRKTDVQIFMLGNSVNKYCPYFAEMGLKHIKEMKQGTIDFYRIPSAGTTIAVEYCASLLKSSPANKYFAFDNKKLEMITSGAWEIDIYPHCPIKYTKKDVLFTYFIEFDTTLLQCEIVSKDDYYFTFIHEKTSELKDPNNDLIYSQKFDPRPNHKRKITKPRTDLEKRIAEFYVRDKVFYQNNDIGEVVRNYLQWCVS